MITGDHGLASMKRGRDDTPVLSNYFHIRITYSKITKEDFEQFDHLIIKRELLEAFPKLDKLRYQLEKGGKNGILHYQGCFSISGSRTRAETLQNKLGICEWNGIEGYLKAQYKPALANQRYVCKEETRIAGPWDYGFTNEVDLSFEELPSLWPRQLELLELIEKFDDSRRIMWIWEPQGNVGKTELAKHLHLKHGAILLDGKRRHIKAQAFRKPSLFYIMNITMRDYHKVDYGAIEAVKDGFYASHFGTEANGMVCRKSPKFICFANAPPNEEAMGEERFRIVRF